MTETKIRPDLEIVPQRDGQRKTLSPDEVERLEELGYRVRVHPYTLENGRRWCTVFFERPQINPEA